MRWGQVGQPVRASSGTGPVAGGRAPATGSVTHSPESQLFELRAGRGGPTPPIAGGTAPGATRSTARPHRLADLFPRRAETRA